MIKEADTFSQNDAFVKIIPDFDDKRSVRSATVNNQFCYLSAVCFIKPLNPVNLH